LFLFDCVLNLKLGKDIMKKFLMTSTVASILLMNVGTALALDFKASKGDSKCPAGSILATPQEAKANTKQACAVLGTWHIARLAGNGSMDGSGYGCKIRDTDSRTLGDSLCVVVPPIKKAIEAGPIWNQADANNKCPKTASKNNGTWTGQWWTTVPNKMSVCEIAVAPPKKAIEAGPIWNQADANNKCPKIASKNNGTWTGQWWTTVPGKMSVCEIQFAK
jgi:hypothetical protein